MERPNLKRINGIASADAVRGLMPVFDLDEALERIEALIVAAARVGRDQVDVISVMPRHDGQLTSSYINECRVATHRALVKAGYAVTYNQGGHHGSASFDVSWAQK
ncbi:hypothetical protein PAPPERLAPAPP_00620 [Brevundimonas phage vB_BpoS-Papperlapapp]|uniref:Uncharacterized protein n=1 Tax=Brevundimonas phage vB_BpoS-Domovoi TaxID=2948598 RepID=A0A9E7MRX0_9CAUD|nr:hypothetical protein DOMOVOI_05390 [Brevundimonas phage vB_BpoS-Domovoi]USN15804.1 hypothetical protein PAPPERLAPAPP_00620 [Brevundimonas phage vB_BpoS-Papperlapapp]